MFLDDLNAYLAADPGISAIAGTNIFPQNIPQNGAMPAVVYRRMHGDSKLTLEGKGQMLEDLFEFESIALDFKTASLLARAVMAAIEGFRGAMGATNVLGIFVHSDARDAYDMERLQFYVGQDFKIWYRDVVAGGVAGGPPIPTVISPRPSAIECVFDGAGAAPGLGSYGSISLPFDCTVLGWVLLADQPGSAVIDVQRSTYGAFPAASSITGADKPTLAAQQSNENLAVTQWTTALLKGDVLQFILNSVAGCNRLNLTLNISIP
jgi:hypothetical protein